MAEVFSKEYIERVFREIGCRLIVRTGVFLIGGCAMTFRDLKPSTRDLDLLFADYDNEKRFLEAALAAGFKELFPGSIEIDLKAKDILVNEDGLQLDLFTKVVMGGLTLSRGMTKRAEKYGGYGQLRVFLASKEDVYLFKAITSRPFPRDYEDLLTLQQSGLDWDAVVSEYKAQIRGRELEKNLKAKLELLKKEGVVNPLMTAVK